MDRYPSFSKLSAIEREGTDYSIEIMSRPNSEIILIAPHGGKIEFNTSEITRKIAGTEFSFYCFNGLKISNNSHLHITSHLFDEPKGVEAVSDHKWAIAIHGFKNGDDNIPILIGGKYKEMIKRFEESLESYGLKFRSSGHQFGGKERMNICNRGSLGQGIQFELSRDFREGKDIDIFISAIRNVLIKDR